MGIGDSYQPAGQTQASEVEADTYEQRISASRITEIPSNLQLRADYDIRTDGQPVYLGFGARSLAAATTGWLLQKFTYDSSGYVTLRQIAYDSWNNRATATYA